MIITLTAEQEARLFRLAASVGRSPDDLGQEAINRFLDEESRFAEAVRIGMAAADRGEFVAAERVWEDIERILQS